MVVRNRILASAKMASGYHSSVLILFLLLLYVLILPICGTSEATKVKDGVKK